jgi:hypothetical protein
VPIVGGVIGREISFRALGAFEGMAWELVTGLGSTGAVVSEAPRPGVTSGPLGDSSREALAAPACRADRVVGAQMHPSVASDVLAGGQLGAQRRGGSVKHDCADGWYSNVSDPIRLSS